MRYSLLIVFSVMFSLQACSPEPVYRLKAQADDDQTTYYRGIEYIHLEKDSILLTVSYVEHTEDLFALDVEVVNNSNKMIRIEPSDFSYTSYEENHPDEAREFITYNKAKDPERKILDLDMEMSQQKANQKTGEALYYTLQGLTIAEAFAANNNKELENVENEIARNEVRQEFDRNRFEFNRRSLKQKKEIWQLDALRISDLLPGEHVRGFIFFKSSPEAQLYKITADIEDLTFESWFRQVKYTLNP